MKYTGNYRLKKPEGTDAVNIEDFNENADKIDSELAKRVEKVAGKGLSTNDYSNAEKQKVADSKTNLDSHVAESASLTKEGHVQLSNSTTSTSTTLAATPSAVKIAKDKADAAFQSASDGKRLIANAITGKGVSTSATASFSVMASNIGNITTATSQTFTTNGTFKVPSGVSGVFITACGAGGGGGGGSASTRQSNNKMGGGGGGGGASILRSFYSVAPNSSLSITIGSGGVGGKGGEATDLLGADGSNGTPTVVGNLVTLSAGGKGTGGSFKLGEGGTSGGVGGGNGGGIDVGGVGKAGAGGTGGGYNDTEYARSGGGGGGSYGGGGGGGATPYSYDDEIGGAGGLPVLGATTHGGNGESGQNAVRNGNGGNGGRGAYGAGGGGGGGADGKEGIRAGSGGNGGDGVVIIEW